jgi:hypothetical protein
MINILVFVGMRIIYCMLFLYDYELKLFILFYIINRLINLK